MGWWWWWWWWTHRDVSSVEVLMNYHHGLKNEVEARSRSLMECIEMGKTLLAVRNPAAEEVRRQGRRQEVGNEMRAEQGPAGLSYPAAEEVRRQGRK